MQRSAATTISIEAQRVVAVDAYVEREASAINGKLGIVGIMLWNAVNLRSVAEWAATAYCVLEPRLPRWPVLPFCWSR